MDAVVGKTSCAAGGQAEMRCKMALIYGWHHLFCLISSCSVHFKADAIMAGKINLLDFQCLELFPVSFMAGTLFTCFCIYGWHRCDMSSILASGSAVCCFVFFTLTGRNSFAGN